MASADTRRCETKRETAASLNSALARATGHTQRAAHAVGRQVQSMASPSTELQSRIVTNSHVIMLVCHEYGVLESTSPAHDAAIMSRKNGLVSLKGCGMGV